MDILASIMATANICIYAATLWAARRLPRGWLSNTICFASLVVIMIYAYVLLINIGLIQAIDPVLFGRAIVRQAIALIGFVLLAVTITLGKALK